MAQNSQPSNIIRFDTVEAIAPTYLWRPYLRENNLNIIRGDGGSGKSMLAVAIAAAITKGEQPEAMPGVLNVTEPGSVFIVSNEDDAGELRHRLDLCGADASRVFSCTTAAIPALSDTARIKSLVTESGAILLVLDPIQAFLPHGTDLNSAGDMRPLLDGLREVCRETGCTALVLEHLNKAVKMAALQRGIGSMDIVNASRSALYVASHPFHHNQRVALHVKANAAHGRAIAFSIDSNGVFIWGGDCDVTEDDLINARNAAKQPENPVLRLVRALADRPQGWRGSAAQMASSASEYGLDVSAKTIGKAMPGLMATLRAEGITVLKSRKADGTLYVIRKGAT